MIGAVAAAAAAYYAKSSPTKKDLERVELNTAESAKHMDAVRTHIAEQNRRELLSAQAQHLSISVSAQNRTTELLEVLFTLKDSTVTLLRVDLINNVDTLSGTVDCIHTGPLTFTANVGSDAVRSWFNSADRMEPANYKMLLIRVFFKIDEQEAHRTFSAQLWQSSRQGPGGPGSSEGVDIERHVLKSCVMMQIFHGK